MTLNIVPIVQKEDLFKKLFGGEAQVAKALKTEKRITLKLRKSTKKIKAKKQIVRNQVRELEERRSTKFLSDVDNVVRKETKAKRIGATQANALGDIKSKKLVETKKLTATNEKLDFSKLANLGRQANRQITKDAEVGMGVRNGDKKLRGLAQSNDYIEELPLGDFTKVNTQKHRYFGFYNRIKEKIDLFWSKNLKDIAYSHYAAGRTIAAEKVNYTGLNVMLDNRGNVISIELKSSSGVRELDNAALESFKKAGPFPNPPKGMISDGVATIEWGFVVNG